MGDEGSDEGRNAMMSHYSYPPCVRSGAVFLGDARIRDASIAQRLSFLEEKGLSRAEANQAFSLFRRRLLQPAARAASSTRPLLRAGALPFSVAAGSALGTRAGCAAGAAARDARRAAVAGGREAAGLAALRDASQRV